ncbi:transglutaminase domain-containing protein [bacterium]|nr:transglutaminase domain-containing protein [bacterium]
MATKRLFTSAMSLIMSIVILTGCASDVQTITTTDTTAVTTLPTEVVTTTVTNSVEDETPEITVVTTEPSVPETVQTTVATTVTTTKPVEAAPAEPAEDDYSMFEPDYNKPNIPNLNINTDPQTFIKYTYAKKNLKPKYLGYCYLYDFDDEKWTGYGRQADTQNYSEMWYGLHAYVEGTNLYIRMYSNCNMSTVKVTKTQLISDNYVKNVRFNPNGEVFNKLNTKNYSNGLYKFAIQIKYSNGFTKWIELHFYVNDGNTYLCSYANENDAYITKAKSRRAKLAQLIEEFGVTPENSVRTDNLCYPWLDTETSKCDTPELIALSNQLVKPEWSDAVKVLAFYEWITSNMSYDYYKLNVTICSRSKYYNDYSGKWNAFTTKTGVCADFANYLVTMCRAQGIPCITAETSGHTWNLVYLNGKWVELDPTLDTHRSVYGEDVTNVKDADDKYNYDAYMTLIPNGTNANEILCLNDALWTVGKANGTELMVRFKS